jgi:hypothetical protein
MPVILAIQETELGKIEVLGQPRQKVHNTPSQQKKTGHGGACLSYQLGWEE